MLKEKKGYFLILLTAIISGFSIFLNKIAIAETNSFVFTFLKSAIVAIFLLSIIILLKDFRSIKALEKKQWLQLAIIGLIGGSIPFLLFFYALKLTTAINAGFLHKTLFIFASIFAFVFLKEKISKQFLIIAIMLLLANFFMFNFVSSFALPDLLVITAVLLWAAENVISKRTLKELNGRIVAFGRMFFGAIFILLFLLSTNQIQVINSLELSQWQWILLASIPLLFYALTFYSGLKYIPVSKATAILMLGQPVTILLSFIFLGQTISFNQAIGIVLALTAILLLFVSAYAVSFLKTKGFSLASTK